VAREMVIDALARYGRPTPNAIRAPTIWLHTYSHRAHTGTRRSTSPQVPERRNVVGAESFSQSGESLAVRR
jgi:hypothetical protein